MEGGGNVQRIGDHCFSSKLGPKLGYRSLEIKQLLGKQCPIFTSR